MWRWWWLLENEGGGDDDDDDDEEDDDLALVAKTFTGVAVGCKPRARSVMTV